MVILLKIQTKIRRHLWIFGVRPLNMGGLNKKINLERIIRRVSCWSLSGRSCRPSAANLPHMALALTFDHFRLMDGLFVPFLRHSSSKGFVVNSKTVRWQLGDKRNPCKLIHLGHLTPFNCQQGNILSCASLTHCKRALLPSRRSDCSLESYQYLPNSEGVQGCRQWPAAPKLCRWWWCHRPLRGSNSQWSGNFPIFTFTFISTFAVEYFWDMGYMLWVLVSPLL